MADLPQNTFKSGLAKRRQQVGLWSSLSSNLVAELVSHAGYDWIVFDLEHGPADHLTTISQLQAIGGGTASGIVRVASNDPVRIKHALDIGALTIIVPQVNDAAEARAAVQAMRYPPDGIRGVGPMARSSRYGAVTGYLREAERELCLVVMCETRSSIENLDEIARVDGVDAILIGPQDLAADMGHLGDPAHDNVIAAIHLAFSKIKSAGMRAGIMVGNPEEAGMWLRRGCDFVGCGSDAALLRSSAAAVARALREHMMETQV